MSASLLDDVEEFLSRFIAFPSEHTRVATVLWAAHTHLLDAFGTTPRLAFLSPEPASGKTRALDILELLCPRTVHAVNCTPAYLFRKVGDEAGGATVLYDEIDTVFGPRAKDNEDIRGMLNAGYKRGAKAGRCVVRGKSVETEEIDAFAAVALAGLGDLPDTVMTRSIVVRMRRRAPNEPVEPYRYRVNGTEGESLRGQLAAWADLVRDRVEGAWPTLPPGLEDRNAEVWEPLLAIAEEAGELWAERARVAAVTLVTQSAEGEGSLGVRLLTDLRDIFGDDDRLTTDVILDRLTELDESPWSDLRGRPLDARGLARRLKAYQVHPKVIRIGDATARGYERADLHDPFQRYLPTPSTKDVTDVTSATPSVPAVPLATPVTDKPTCAECGEPMAVLEPWQTTHPGCRERLEAVL